MPAMDFHDLMAKQAALPENIKKEKATASAGAKEAQLSEQMVDDKVAIRLAIKEGKCPKGMDRDTFKSLKEGYWQALGMSYNWTYIKQAGFTIPQATVQA